MSHTKIHDMNLAELKAKKLAQKNQKSNSKKGIDHKGVLIDFLENIGGTKEDVKIECAAKWYETLGKDDVSEDAFDKKMVTFGNAFDTMRSNFNSEEKINNDPRLKGKTWEMDAAGVVRIK